MNQRLNVLVFAGFALVLASVLPAVAQDAKDGTGTDPTNITWDWRAYVEMQAIQGGDNSRTVLTIEQKVPLGKNASFRFRARHVSLSLDPDSDGSSTEISGMGDWETRLLYIAKADRRRALAMGLEATFDTASNQFLGSGKNTLGPQIFAVLFNPPGGGVLLAPAYQYIFDVGGDEGRADVSKSQFNLFYVWLDKGKKWWVVADQSAVLDHENETEFGLLKVEYGRMMLGGMSSYVKPSIGVGNHRPHDWSVEFGFKAIYN